MREIGRVVSEEELVRSLSGGPLIVDTFAGRLIYPEELYTPTELTTLDWKTLGNLFRRSVSSGSSVKFPKIGSFDNLLWGLISPLARRGDFTSTLQEGFYYLVNSPFGGIRTFNGEMQDSAKRRYAVPVTFYPKRVEDARSYVRHFCSNSNGEIFPALILSRD